MLSRKHYEEIANVIHAARNTSTVEETRAFIAGHIALWLGEDNPRFDQDTFFAACGVGNYAPSSVGNYNYQKAGVS